jgi:hypothetical protein
MMDTYIRSWTSFFLLPFSFHGILCEKCSL